MPVWRYLIITQGNWNDDVGGGTQSCRMRFRYAIVDVPTAA